MNGLLFICPLYKYNRPLGGMMPSFWQVERVQTYMPLFILAAVITLLPLVAIFFFKNRKRQRGMVWMSIISIFSFVAVMLMRKSNLENGTPPVANFQYLIPGVLVTLVALVFLILALRGIRKDERLIKSLDRLR